MLERIEAKNQSRLRYTQKSLERIEQIKAMKDDNSQEVLIANIPEIINAEVEIARVAKNATRKSQQ